MRTLLVASTGGHLLELHALRERFLTADDDVVWVTFDTSQSQTLLRGEEIVLVPTIFPRDYRGVFAGLLPARRILAETGAERVVSTGAAVALTFLPAAHRRGLSCHYIESAARTDGPSATGRLLESLRAASLYTQHASWETGRWRFAGSVFDGIETAQRPQRRSIRRVVVSLGTSPFPFRRLLQRLATILPRDAEVLWQVGGSHAPDLPGEVVTSLRHDQLLQEMAAADLVVCHAGVGSALAAMSVGRCPVLVPRRAVFGEHVDEHQQQVARELRRRGIAVVAEADLLTLADLETAAATDLRTAERPPVFRLTDQALRANGPTA